MSIPTGIGFDRLIRALVRTLSGCSDVPEPGREVQALWPRHPRGKGLSAQPRGVVAGAPRRWLGLEGLVLLAGALIAFGAIGQPWWLVPAAILAPDVAMAGYLAGTRPGARLYNLTHATPLPAVMHSAPVGPTSRERPG